MSRKERDRLKVMASLEAGRVKQVEAARLLRLNPSYAVKKILAAFGCREAAWRGRGAGCSGHRFSRPSPNGITCFFGHTYSSLR